MTALLVNQFGTLYNQKVAANGSASAAVARPPEHEADTLFGHVVLSSPPCTQASSELSFFRLSHARSLSPALSYFDVFFFTPDCNGEA